MKIRVIRRQWKPVIPSHRIKRGAKKVFWFVVEGEHPITYDEIDYCYMLRWK